MRSANVSRLLLAATVLLFFNGKVLAGEESKVDHVQLEGQVTRAATKAATDAAATETNDSDTSNAFDALDQIPKLEVIKSGLAKKLVSKVVSVGNFVLDLRGFDWSVEGANVVLEEKTNYKSVLAKEFAVRKVNDGRELETVATIFQTGMVSGINDIDKRKKLLEANNTKLVKLLGEGSAKQVVEHFKSISEDQSALKNEQGAEAAAWTIDEQQEMFKTIVESTIERDPEIKNLLTRMHKFNGRSKLMRVTAKIVYTTLGIAAFSPTFVAPAAEASLLAFMTATGGPEQDKLLREIYLYKCLESRYKTIHEEAHLAVSNAQIAALTNNKPLTACTIELMNRMAGKETVAKVFPSTDSKQLAEKLKKTSM